MKNLPNEQALEPVAEPEAKPKKKYTRIRSPYERYRDAQYKGEKAITQDDGTFLIVDSKGRPVAESLPPEKMVARAAQMGLTLEQYRTHYAEGRQLEALKGIFRRHMGLKPDDRVDVDHPFFQELKERLFDEGLVPYSPIIARDICQRYAMGELLGDILGKAPYPSLQVFAKWKTKYPEFKAAVEQARVDRADFLMMQVEDLARFTDSSNSKAMKVKIDTLKHVAAVSDPEKYGQRTKIVGDPNAPVAFTVVSRIPDPETPEQPLIPDGTKS